MTGYRPICDLWILARSKLKDGKKYYGSYPSGYLSRAMETLGVQADDPVLHVCSGMVRDYPFRGLGPRHMTVDLDPGLDPDWVMDVRDDLPRCPFDPDGWAAILADPPYTEEDAAHYKVGASVFPKPNALLKLMLLRARPGGKVGMLHYVWPRPPSMVFGTNRKPAVPAHYRGISYKAQIRSVACAGVVVGFGNRMRTHSVFEKELPVDSQARLGYGVERRSPSVFVVRRS